MRAFLVTLMVTRLTLLKHILWWSHSPVCLCVCTDKEAARTCSCFSPRACDLSGRRTTTWGRERGQWYRFKASGTRRQARTADPRVHHRTMTTRARRISESPPWPVWEVTPRAWAQDTVTTWHQCNQATSTLGRDSRLLGTAVMGVAAGRPVFRWTQETTVEPTPSAGQ